MPTGGNVRIEGNGQRLYRAMRDLRSQARGKERRQEAGEAEAGARMSVPKEWEEIRPLAVSVLSEHSKDVEVLVWLTEAETRIDGYAGLARSARLIADLVRNFGTALHPEPEEPDDDRFAAIAGLNGVGREGTLVQPLRLLPLVPGAAYGQFTLWDVESGAGSDTVRAAMHEAGGDAMRRHYADIAEALDAIRDCDLALTEIAGTDAPPFAQILDVLDNTERAVRRLASLDGTQSPEEQQDERSAPVSNTAVRTPGTDAINSREEAFEQLLRIAAYFRRAEPHSPTADSLETLVRRGRLGFLALIQEFIPDESARQAVMKTAGIQAPPQDLADNG